MSNRIVISGSPGSGKTALVRELGKMGLHTCPEAGALHINELLRQGKSVEQIVADRLALERSITRVALDNEMDLPQQNLIFLDRSSVDSIAYARHVGIDVPYLEEIQRQSYYPTVFIPQHLSILDDRLESGSSEALTIEQHVRNVYMERGMQICDVPLMSTRDRIHFILSFLANDPNMPHAKAIIDALPAATAPRLTYENIHMHTPFQEFSKTEDASLQAQGITDNIARNVVSGFILNKDDEILILERSATSKHAPGSLETPGGKQEKDETLAEAIRREVGEETGLKDIERISLIGQCDIRSSLATWRGFTFTAYANSTHITLSPREHSRAMWKKLIDKDFFDNVTLNSPTEFMFMRHLQKHLQKS